MSDVENKTDAQWEKLAHSWVHAFITATKTSRLYGREPPGTQRCLGKNHSGINPNLGELRNRQTGNSSRSAEGAQYYDQPLQQTSRQSVFSALLLDHIGGLQITTGMDKSELNEFFEILYRPVKEFDENSVGTLLWEANLPHIEIVRLPELLTSNQAEADEDGEAVIDDLIAAALRDNIDTEAPVQPWRTTVRLDSLSADQAAELRDLEKPTDITSQFRSLDHRERSRERVQKALTQPHLGNDPAFAQAVVASVAENATVSDILAAREALLALGVDSLEKSTPTQAKQYFDQATKLLTNGPKCRYGSS